MLLAGLSVIQLPPAILSYLHSPPVPLPGVPRAAPPAVAVGAAREPARWSGDAWLLFRDGDAPLAAGQPSYGRSQAGAVLRYRLLPLTAHRREAYLRGSSALAGPREREAAVGLSARPFPGVPVRVAAEARVSDTAQGTEVRPAAFAVTELPQFALPLGARGEGYLQAGYVGGKFATAFVDGQARAERKIISRGDAELAAGGGLWGGAQKGAARLDVGPTAAVTFRLGEGRGRVAADYRFRVAGMRHQPTGPP